jgi:predicted SAM-dependent methyltransferase
MGNEASLVSRYLNPLRLLAGVGRRASAFSARRAKARRYARAKLWLSDCTVPIKANVGCGQEPFQGWANIDLESNSRADIIWDVTDGLPFGNDSCAFIYCEHFLEHLPVQDGLRFLTECHRCLQKGGVVRTGMPSAEELVRNYYENDWAKQPWLEKYGFAWIKTRAEYINICFREWGHQWLYDLEELERRLREAGFDKIKKAKWGESEHLEFRNRETRKETLLICEATK